jgi:methionyl aminopeptidase
MRPKTPDEIAKMREGGKMLATILNSLQEKVLPGVRPKDIANIAADEIKKMGMQPVVLGYEGFPDVICISVNEGIVHGIPNSTLVISRLRYKMYLISISWESSAI